LGRLLSRRVVADPGSFRLAVISELLLNDKNSPNYTLYQGTPSGVLEVPDDRQGL